MMTASTSQSAVVYFFAVHYPFQVENIRRKHNYLPLIVEVLKVLAKRGELVQLCEQVIQSKFSRLGNWVVAQPFAWFT